jgi:hypothetical protein
MSYPRPVSRMARVPATGLLIWKEKSATHTDIFRQIKVYNLFEGGLRMHDKNELCEKITSLFPEIGQCGIDVEVDYNSKKNAGLLI